MRDERVWGLRLGLVLSQLDHLACARAAGLAATLAVTLALAAALAAAATRTTASGAVAATPMLLALSLAAAALALAAVALVHQQRAERVLPDYGTAGSEVLLPARMGRAWSVPDERAPLL